MSQGQTFSSEPKQKAPASAQSWLEQVVVQESTPVVMFGVGWCGYCWAARDVLQQLEVPFRYIDADSSSDLGGFSPSQMRQALRDQTASHTIPQIFIGGESIGGATELMSALRSGRLAGLLQPLGITLKAQS